MVPMTGAEQTAARRLPRWLDVTEWRGEDHLLVMRVGDDESGGGERRM
jgi:hypothetical protein